VTAADELKLIVTAVGAPDDLITLLAVAAPLARACGGTVVPLCITEERERPNWLRVPDELQDVVEEPVLLHHTNAAKGILSYLRHTSPDLLLLEWSGEISRGRYLLGRTLDPILQYAPCNVAVLRTGENPADFRERMASVKRILVPSGGGPNASLALHIARHLSDGAETTPLRVASTSLGPTAVLAQWDMLKASLGDDLTDERLRPRVVQAGDVVEGILEQAADGHELVLIGATQESLVDRLIFGNLPQTLASRLDLPLIIVRRRDPVASGVLRQARWRVLNLMTQLTEDERIRVYRQVRRNARTSNDFYVMMMGATGIATLGLMLNSSAVIIGAMLVAPLMAALLGIGMGIVQGDSRLVRMALRTTVLGIVVAIAVSMTIGLLVPERKLTSEMLGRCSPTILDLAIALISGAAAAYASAHKDVSGALTGTAIAVALVPPLATFGLLAVGGELQLASGALLLFLTNLIAIVSAVALVLLWVGFRPNTSELRNAKTFRSGIAGSLAVLCAITVLLGVLTARSYRAARFDATVELVLKSQVSAMGAGAELEAWQVSPQPDGTLSIKAQIASGEEITPEQASALQQSLAHNLGRSVAVSLQVLPTTHLDALP